MTDTVTYDEHRAFLNRLVDGALAEYAGFSNASIFDEMIASYSTDPRIQARYQRGFEDGKAMVLAEKEAVR